MKLLALLSKMAVLTVLSLLIFASVQQTYRSNANDPQIQVAEDLCQQIKEGKTFEKGLPGDSLDISKSLGVFITIYDNNHLPLKSTGFLDGNPPSLPSGVFEFTRTKGEDQVTWQPRPGVRIALVVAAVQSSKFGFVAVGRSLREVEIRESNLQNMVVISWALCMGVLLINGWIQYRFRGKIKMGV
jgi:hypothetical protein